MQWACLWRGTFTYASDCSLTARVPTYVQKEKTLKKNISSKLALRLGWRHTVDCLEDDLRCFGIGGRVPPIYVRCLFPFKLPYFRYMGILGSRHLFPEVIKWNQWEAAFFFAAKFQWMWTATQLRKNMPEFKKLSPVSELLQKKNKKGIWIDPPFRCGRDMLLKKVQWMRDKAWWTHRLSWMDIVAIFGYLEVLVSTQHNSVLWFWCCWRQVCLYVVGFPCQPYSYLHQGSSLLKDPNARQLFQTIRNVKRMKPLAPLFAFSHYRSVYCEMFFLLWIEPTNQQTPIMNLDLRLRERYGFPEMPGCCIGVDWEESCRDPWLQSKLKHTKPDANIMTLVHSMGWSVWQQLQN